MKFKEMLNEKTPYERTEIDTLLKKDREKRTSRGSSSPMICRECGRTFNKVIGKKTYEVKCPKCGSYDTEVL